MTPAEFKALEVGELVRNTLGGEAYVITYKATDYLIATRTMHLCNPSEWTHIKRAPSRPPPAGCPDCGSPVVVVNPSAILSPGPARITLYCTHCAFTSWRETK